MSLYSRMEFNVCRENSFATSSTRSRCEYLLRNNRLVNDWNTVVEQLLLQNQPKTVKKKRKKKNNQEKVKSQHILLLEQKLNEDQEHRKRLLEDHAHLESTVTNINTELENEKEKTRKTLKLAYLLRLEIAKQKTMIAEQQTIIQQADSRIDNVKSELQAEIKEEVKGAREELKKFQEIFLEQQKLMREMQDGTISDVKETRTMLKELQEQTLELIELQKAHESTLEEKLINLEIQARQRTPTPEPPVKSPSPPPKEPTPEPSPSPPPAQKTPSPVPSVKSVPDPDTSSIGVGCQALARMPDEGNDGWFYRVTVNAKNDDGKYRVECSEGLVDITAEDIVNLTNIGDELEVEETVIASHPHYQATYAPGVIVKKGLEKTYQVRFYDGTEGMIRKSETHRVEPERFENIVDFILQLEQRWIDENVIARDDKTGVYKIGTVKDRIGSGHEYLIEWANQDNKQTCSIQHLTCIFGQYSKRRILNEGDHVLGLQNQSTLEYYPGIITKIEEDQISISFSNDTRTTNGKVNETFWISREYYQLAKEYIDTKDDTFSVYSSDN